MKNLGNIILFIFSILFVLVILESATRLLFKHEYRTLYDHRMSQPAPYQHSSFYSKAFIKESFKQPGDWVNPEGSRILYPENFNGEYFNVKNNRRVTTNQPDSFAINVFLFGGSTIYNSEVSDEHTVASYLQRALNNKKPSTFRVINYGVTSANTAQQLERLETIDIHENDIVVFYGGVNDAMLFTSGRINGWIVGENIVSFSQLNVLQRIRFKLYFKLRKQSRFAEKFFNPFTYHLPAHLNDSLRVEEMKVELANSYNNSIEISDSIVKSKNARFYNFVQPSLLTRSNMTDYEKELLQNEYLVPQMWQVALHLSYPVILNSNNEFKNKGIYSNNLTNLFDTSPDSHYLDFCHITEKGNNLIANAIYSAISN